MSHVSRWVDSHSPDLWQILINQYDSALRWWWSSLWNRFFSLHWSSFHNRESKNDPPYSIYPSVIKERDFSFSTFRASRQQMEGEPPQTTGGGPTGTRLNQDLNRKAARLTPCKWSIRERLRICRERTEPGLRPTLGGSSQREGTRISVPLRKSKIQQIMTASTDIQNESTR